MVVRKPYAFLIKHFKLIHLILAIFLIFIVNKTTNLYKFFANYAKNGFFGYTENLARSYITIFTFISLIIILFLSISIFILLRWKNKERNYYIILCLYYFLLFVVFIIFYYILETVEVTSIDLRLLRLYRDIILILIVPQYIFIAMTLARGLGFNVKKFNFEKDLEELKIERSDYEEIEITASADSYKVKRRIRRLFREFKYYLLENKFIFVIVIAIILVGIGFYVHFNRKPQNRIYKPGEIVSVNGISFKVVETYRTKIDYKGEVIKPNKEYILVLVEAKNITDKKRKLQRKDFNLVTSNYSIRPSFVKDEYFFDIGKSYSVDMLYPGENNKFMLVFETEKGKLEKGKSKKVKPIKEYIFKLNSERNIAENSNIILKIKDYRNKIKTNNFNIGEEIKFEGSTLEKGKIIVESFEIGDSFDTNFDYYIDEKRFTGTKHIIPKNIGGILNTVLKLKVSYFPNDKAYSYKYINTISNFIRKFCKIEYQINGEVKLSKVEVLYESKNNIGEIYLSVPEEIKNSDKAYIVIAIRDIKNLIKIK